MENFPKQLLEVGGKAILDWLIEDIADVVDEFIVISYRRFSKIFRDWSEKRPEKITVVDDGTSTNETRLGAVKDSRFAIERLDIDDDVLVLAGDSLLDFSLKGFEGYSQKKGTSCVMCHEENRLATLQKTAVITMSVDGKIETYEEKPVEPKGNHAVPPFYYYLSADVKRIPEALETGGGYDAPGSFAAWLSKTVDMHAYVMHGKWYDIGDIKSYEYVKEIFVKEGFES